MMRLYLVLLLYWCLPLGVQAATYFYPNSGKPLFSFDIPDDWVVEAEEDLLHTGPPDRSLYLGFIALDANLSGDQVGSAVEEIIANFVTDPSVNSEEDLQVNGMPFSYMEGSGLDEEGQPMNFGVAMFSPDGKVICLIIYLGSPDNEQRYEGELIRIIESIRRGGPAQQMGRAPTPAPFSATAQPTPGKQLITCTLDGVIYLNDGSVYGCEGGGNWCANSPPMQPGVCTR